MSVMGGQQEIRINLGKVQEFLFGKDREDSISAFRANDGVFNFYEGNGAAQAQTNAIMKSKPMRIRISKLLLESEVPEQIELVGILEGRAKSYKKDSLEVALAVMEIAMETQNLHLKEGAENLLRVYIAMDVNRAGLMRALAAESELNTSWENAGMFRKLANDSLECADAHEHALQILMNVAAHTEAQIMVREAALLDVGMQFLRGTDISCIEMKLRSLAENREGALFKNARALLATAKIGGFNRPGEKASFEKPGSRHPLVFAPPQLKRTGTLG